MCKWYNGRGLRRYHGQGADRPSVQVVMEPKVLGAIEFSVSVLQV